MRIGSSLLILVMALYLGISGLPVVQAQAFVDQRVFEQLGASPTGEATFLVYMGARADLSAASAMPLGTARKMAAAKALKATADRSQVPVRALLRQLQAQGLVSRYQSFFTDNSISVTGREGAVLALARAPGVVRIEPEEIFSVLGRFAGVAAVPKLGAGVDAAQFNIKQIKANRAWRLGFRGQGVVVATIDTGVRYTHEALRGNYMCGVAGPHGNCWLDAVNNLNAAPYDDYFHGTHVTGTMAGRLGIGVAKKAKWIACKAFDSGGNGSSTDINECADFYLGLALNADTAVFTPDVINNSWGDLRGSTFFNVKIDAWLAAGIIPAFAIGNSGSACSTSNGPGEYTPAFAAGAVDGLNNIAAFSSRGRASAINGGTRKPDISAPGVSIRSAIHTGDTDYGFASGTSMASPHNAGTAALILSKNPTQTPAQVRSTIESTATQISDLTCGGVAGDNNVYGHGLIDALAAVNATP